MSSQDFPTYGRGDEPPEEPQQPAVPSAQPYGQPGQYGEPRPDAYGQPGQAGPAPYQPTYGQPTGQPTGQPQGPGQQLGQGGPGQYTPGQYTPGQYGPGQYGQQYQPSPYSTGGGQPFPPPGQGGMQPPPQAYAGQQPIRAVEPNGRIARLALIGGIVAAFYGLLVLTLQRTALREIAQAPGSPLNHPLRTDILDTIGQLAVAGLTGVVLALWIKDVLERRKQGRSPVVSELVAFGLIAVAAVFVLVWVVMIASTGFGSVDDTTGRLPTAYGYGGFGLWLLAAGLFVVYYALRPDVPMIVQQAPNRPPWES